MLFEHGGFTFWLFIIIMKVDSGKFEMILDS